MQEAKQKTKQFVAFVFLLRCMASVARQQAEGGKTKQGMQLSA
jgi:hypothetical protein